MRESDTDDSVGDGDVHEHDIAHMYARIYLESILGAYIDPDTGMYNQDTGMYNQDTGMYNPDLDIYNYIAFGYKKIYYSVHSSLS